MSRNLAIFAVGGLLAACGGGSDGPATTTTAANATTPAPAPISTTPAPTQTTTPTTPPVSTSAELASMPAVTAGAPTMNGSGLLVMGSFKQAADARFSGEVKIDITGVMNTVWVDAKAAGGTVAVSGNQNTVVFRPGVDATVNVTGSANTFIMATGSTIKIEGSGAAASTIQHYKP